MAPCDLVNETVSERSTPDASRFFVANGYLRVTPVRLTVGSPSPGPLGIPHDEDASRRLVMRSMISGSPDGGRGTDSLNRGLFRFSGDRVPLWLPV